MLCQDGIHVHIIQNYPANGSFLGRVQNDLHLIQKQNANSKSSCLYSSVYVAQHFALVPIPSNNRSPTKLQFLWIHDAEHQQYTIKLQLSIKAFPNATHLLSSIYKKEIQKLLGRFRCNSVCSIVPIRFENLCGPVIISRVKGSGIGTQTEARKSHWEKIVFSERRLVKGKS